MTLEGLSHGASHIRQVIILEPLFEEANRTRRTLACVMRALDDAGIGIDSTRNYAGYLVNDQAAG